VLLSQQQCVILVQSLSGSPEPGALLWLAIMVRQWVFHFHVSDDGNCKAVAKGGLFAATSAFS
jgi:hypothetical protein